jgi:hypothetical protein
MNNSVYRARLNPERGRDQNPKLFSVILNVTNLTW